jgi:glutathione S-transferase
MAMILYNGPTSPFGRTVKVTALELRAPVEERVIDVYAAAFLDDANPLRQIPTLVLENGQALYDSRVICAYLDIQGGDGSLYRAADAWALQVRIALGIGLMEAGLQRRMEILRPDGERSPSVVEKLEARIGRAIDHLERAAEELAAPAPRMDQIVWACALEYTDFRFTTAWRATAPRLAEWLEGFARRESMVESRPA